MLTDEQEQQIKKILERSESQILREDFMTIFPDAIRWALIIDSESMVYVKLRLSEEVFKTILEVYEVVSPIGRSPLYKLLKE